MLGETGSTISAPPVDVVVTVGLVTAVAAKSLHRPVMVRWMKARSEIRKARLDSEPETGWSRNMYIPLLTIGVVGVHGLALGERDGTLKSGTAVIRVYDSIACSSWSTGQDHELLLL